MKELKQGNTGLSVALWSTFLISLNFMEQHSYDYKFFELFGTETKAATKRYQQSNGLVDSGFLDKILTQKH
jgi:peptidoglycan hydrolase-like protein with peptidoglycan-binding domain